MKKLYADYIYNLIYYLLPVVILFNSYGIKAQQKNPTITFQKPSELVVDTLDFDLKNQQLSKTFDFINNSGIKKTKGSQIWKYDQSKFTVICNNKAWTKSFKKNYKGELPFNDEIQLFKIYLKPNFSNNELTRIKFYEKGTKNLVYEAICKYPFLVVEEKKIELTLNNKGDTLVKKTVVAKNIGFKELNLKVSAKSQILSLNSQYKIPSNDSIEIDFEFRYPKSIQEKQESDSQVVNDRIKKETKISFVNLDFPKNKAETNVITTLIEIQDPPESFNYLYLLWLLIPICVFLAYLFIYKKSFLSYKNRVNKFYTKRKNKSSIEDIVNDARQKFILNEKTLSDSKINYFLEKTIVVTKGKVFSKDFENMFKEQESDTENSRELKESYKNYKKSYKESFNVNIKSEENTNIKKVIELILKSFLQNSLTLISKGIERKDLDHQTLDLELKEGTNQIGNIIDQQKEKQQLSAEFINEVKAKAKIDDDDKVLAFLKQTFEICKDVKDGEIFKKIKGNASNMECITSLEKDWILIKKIKEKINYSNSEKDLAIEIEEVYKNYEKLQEQQTHIPDKKMLLIVFNRIFKIIDTVKDKSEWKNEFRNNFFKSLRDEDNRIRNSLVDALKDENAKGSSKISLDDLKHTLSELFRIYAFSKIDIAHIKNNFTNTSFPVNEYEANILLLKALILKIYDSKIIIPELFVDEFDSELHKKADGVSGVLRDAPKEIYANMSNQIIVDFEEIVLKPIMSNTNQKIKIFTE